jgi:hypothetical protein
MPGDAGPSGAARAMAAWAAPLAEAEIADGPLNLAGNALINN